MNISNTTISLVLKYLIEDFNNRMFAQWRDEIDRRQGDIMRHEDASNTYMDEGVALLSMAQRAPRLLDSQTGIEKRRVLNFVLSNCIWKDDKLHAEFRQPFDLLAKTINGTPPSDGGGNGGNGEFETWLGN